MHKINGAAHWVKKKKHADINSSTPEYASTSMIRSTVYNRTASFNKSKYIAEI